MKSLRLFAPALLACVCTVSAAIACDNQKSGKADATTASAQCTPAMKAACAKGASMAGMDHCSGAKSAMFVAASAAGMRCASHQNGVAHECAACESWTALDQAAHAIGARSQVVPIKNGAMIVYTADSPANVRALQALVAKRNDQMLAALAGGSEAKLCDDCKPLRGAMASGKLNREIVNVEKGCMALITSNDRGVVQKIRTMTGQPLAMR